MAAPTAPTIANICTEALKRGGIVNPSATQITAAQVEQFSEVKSDISMWARNHPYLLTNGVILGVTGQSHYDWPTTDALGNTVGATDIKSIQRLEGDDDHRGTATAGGATSITLAADFSFDEADVEGRWLVTLGGTGPGQINQIVAYNNSTKVATLKDTWGTNPASGTTYMVVTDHQNLPIGDTATDWALLKAPFTLGDPTWYSLVGEEIWTNRAFDRTYVLWVHFWQDLDTMDEAGTLLLRLLSEWRSLWIQGIATYTMQRYDDDRAAGQFQIYNAQLAMLGEKASKLGQVRFHDV